MDFTLKTYKQLLNTLLTQNYTFQTFQEFILDPSDKTMVMRHDVDRLPGNALKIAELEERLGVRGSYYFRAVPESFDKEIIKKIAGMGHEVGYHYENLAEIAKKLGDREEKKGFGIWDLGFGKKKAEGRMLNAERLYSLAIEDFKRNLAKMRKLYPVKTICMHGSPLSEYDSRDLWKKYNYRDFGIIGEPYFDIDFSKVLYLTDTGRRWDGDKFNIRDKVSSQPSAFSFQQTTKSEIRNPKPETNSNDQNSNDTNKKTINDKLGNLFNDSEQSERMTSSEISFHSTFDIINALGKGLLPDQIMINTHPQRWTDKTFPWVKEFVCQNFKNLIKSNIVARNKKK